MRKYLTAWWTWLSIILVLSVGLIEAVHWEWLHQRQLSQQRELVLAGADARAELEARLSNAIFVATGLETFIESQEGKLDREDIRSWLFRMIERDDAIRNIGIAPDNRLEFIYPEEGNEQVLGVYYADLREQWPTIQRIMRTRKPAIDGPLNLIQGGRGLIYRIPVIIEDQYWGMVATVLDADRILEVAERLQKEHDLTIQLFRSDQGQTNTFFGPQLSPKKVEYEGVISLPGDQWHLRLQHAEPDAFSAVFRSIAYLGLALLMGLGAGSFHSRYRQHRYEQALQAETDRLKNAFVATVSHELRTPVTSILGSLALMKNRTLGPVTDQQHQMLDIAHRNAEHLSLLINDLLDIEKISTGHIQYRMEDLTVSEQVREAIESVASLAGKKSMPIHLHTNAPDARCPLDRQRFQQVMNNLLSNAIKFSPEASPIDVTLNADQRFCTIAVRDRGPGIPESFQKHLFHRFRQADDSDTRSAGGSGLGLAITKGLVEGMGGTIRYTTGPKIGTSFQVQFPLTTKAQAPEAGAGLTTASKPVTEH